MSAATGSPQRLERAQLVASAAILGGLLHLHYVKFLRDAEYKGTLGPLYEDVVNGNADAPYQYRILVPRFVVWLHHLSGVTYRLVGLVVDGAALFGGAIAVLALAKAVRLSRAMLAIALYIAFLGYSTTVYAKPETMVAFFATSLLALAFVRHDEKGATLLLLVAAAVLAGTRIDTLAAFAVAYFARWWWQRRRTDLWAAVVLVALAVVSLVGMKAAYPDATYPKGLSLVQLGHNVGPGTFLIPLLFLLPAMVPVWMLRGRIREAIGIELAALGVAVVVFSAEACVIGRIEETRLWFPFAGVVGCIGAAAWIAAGVGSVPP